MGTKNKSAGSQHTPRGITQGVSLVAPDGLPIDSVVDNTGKHRLAVDANVIINNATVNVDIDATTDNIAIRNTNNSSELLINGDGSINANVAITAVDGDNIAIHDADGDELEINGDGSINAVVTATDLDIRDLTHISDSVKIGDGSDFLAVNGDGSINVGNTVTVQATDFDIRDLTHVSDSVKIGDGSDFLLINPDGSINVVTTGTVTVNQGTNPWNIKIDQTGSNNDVDVLTLPNVTLASQANPFTSDLPVSVNNSPTVKLSQTGSDNDVDVLTLPAVTQGTTPWVTALSQTGSNNDVDVLTLPNVTLASQPNPFTTSIPTAQAEEQTFVAYASNIAIGNNKSMLSILNATGTSVNIRIKNIYIMNSQTSAVTGVVADFNVFRITGHSAGTSITPSAYDTSDSLNVNVTVRTGATIAGEGTATLRRWLWSSDDWGTGTLDVEAAEHVSQNLIAAYSPGLKDKPITLRTAEGLTLKQVTNSTAGQFDIMVIFTQV